MAVNYNKISDRLDYNLVDIEERKEYVDKLMEEYDDFFVEYYSGTYNPHLNQNGLLSENTKMGKDLESIANYLLYAEGSDKSIDIITEHRKKRNSKESSLEDFMNVKEPRKETNRSIIKVPKIKVNDMDRKEYKELQRTGEAISNLSKMIKNKVDSKGNEIPDVEVRRMMWIRTDIQKDEVAIKNDLKGYIRFQNITRSEPDDSSFSFVQFDDPEVVRVIIENYSDLKQSSYDDTYGYLKIILFVFEDLVSSVDLKDFMEDILVWKIEGVTYDDMIKTLKDKYDMKMTKPRLSKLTRETLPNMIVEAYKQQREDWVYTYVFKGKYKTCIECKTPLLESRKYFNPDKTAKSGFKPVCKKCRRKNYKKKKSRTKVSNFCFGNHYMY